MKYTPLALALGWSLSLFPVSATPSIQWMPQELTPVGSTQYESYHTPSFQQGLMLVSTPTSEGTSYGYINQQGSLVIQPTFLDAKPFSTEVALAPAAVLTTILLDSSEEDTPREEGEEQAPEDTIPPQDTSQEETDTLEPAPDLDTPSAQDTIPQENTQSDSNPPSEEEAPYIPEEITLPLFGYIDTTGHFILPPAYTDAHPFTEGLAAVTTQGDLWGFINLEGELVIQEAYTWAGDFSGGYAVVQQGELYGLIDTQGNQILPIAYQGLGNPADVLFPAMENNKYGFIDIEGNIVVPFTYSSSGYFSHELALVEKNGQWTYMDTLGRPLGDFLYNQAFHFSQGMAWVELNGQYCYIDTSGKVVLDGLEGFSYVTSFQDGYARGKKNLLYGFMDKTGTTIVPYQYQNAIPVSQGTGLVYDGTRWGTFTPTPRTNTWAENYITQAENLSLIPYQLQGIDLTAPMNRTQFVALALSLYDAIQPEATDPFPALANNPFQDTRDLAVRRGYQLGITSGITPTLFGAYDTLTREQAATILSVLYTLLTQEEVGIALAPPFDDHQQISSWARDNVYFLAEKGVLTGIGDNLFDPSASISAESALVMVLAMNNLLS